MFVLEKSKIAIIGLGYVGLPLAVAFSKKYSVIGFDINKKRINDLKGGTDSTLEVSEQDLLNAKQLSFEYKSEKIGDCNVYIITVPTPIDEHKQPDLTPLIKASTLLGSLVKKGDVIIYESTVYPGATEDKCIPFVEDVSGLKLNEDFFAGYSPERINPGDKEHTVTNILKVTSGSTPESARIIDELYKSIISAGTHLAPSIKIAEAAKVIENSQRDINIAFINELAKIFNLLEIDTHAVLEAAGTKWNFLPFKPGLVGGHCIGVDPYYLAKKAQDMGYNPEIILSGRKLNDSMGVHVANQVIKLMKDKKIALKGSKVLILGITFKENCPDVRNTRVVDIIWHIKRFEATLTIYDPWADKNQVKKEYNINITKTVPKETFDVIILAVSHNQFLELDLNKIKNKNCVVYDVKGFLGNNADAKL